MGIPILVSRLYIETGPKFHCHMVHVTQYYIQQDTDKGLLDYITTSQIFGLTIGIP